MIMKDINGNTILTKDLWNQYKITSDKACEIKRAIEDSLHGIGLADNFGDIVIDTKYYDQYADGWDRIMATVGEKIAEEIKDRDFPTSIEQGKEIIEVLRLDTDKDKQAILNACATDEQYNHYQEYEARQERYL